MNIQLLESISVLLISSVVYFITQKAVRRTLTHFEFGFQRIKMTTKLIHFLIFASGLILLIAIWGVDQKELVLFISSIVTVLGIAFFAQWSLLSNVTSSLILFFNHPIKLGQQIRVLDKDYQTEGTVEDITYFFVYLRSADGSLISIPNSVMLYKTLSINPDDRELSSRNGHTEVKS
ncbi:MAG: mechanosensitive ion channel [Cytophagaceae bacterium]|nr:mechanosensitive ion channel [Cytophagaceae bacterium]